MFKLIQSFLFLIFIATTPVRGDCFDNLIKKSEISLGYTYRQDDIKFKFENSVLGFSDEQIQTFEQVKIQQATFLAKFITCNKLYFRGKGDYGWIFDGHTHHTDEIAIFSSKQKSCLSDDCVFDLSGGVGYALDCGCGTGFTFVPMFGYSWNRQDLSASSWKIASDTLFELKPGTSLHCLKRSYLTSWFGPWLGFDIILDYFCEWKLFFEFEYHWPDYEATFIGREAKIGQITIHSRHRDDCGFGQGYCGSIGVKSDCCGNWFWYAMGGFQSWNIDHGRGKSTNGELHDLSFVDWTSYQGTIGFGIDF